MPLCAITFAHSRQGKRKVKRVQPASRAPLPPLNPPPLSPPPLLPPEEDGEDEGEEAVDAVLFKIAFTHACTANAPLMRTNTGKRASMCHVCV